MTTLDLPGDDGLIDVTLEPVQRDVLGAADAVGDQPERIALGTPIGRLVDPATLDDDAKSFLAGRTGSTFTLLKVTVGFVHQEEDPFESAWVDVRFEGPGGDGTSNATVWSMQPLSDSDPVNVATKVTMDASLKLTGLLSAVSGPSVGKEKDRSYVEEAVKVEAIGEGTATPRWRFSPTVTSPIRGTHRLVAVVETPAGASATADISVGATIRLRKLKVFRYEGALEQLPDVAHFVVPPSA